KLLLNEILAYYSSPRFAIAPAAIVPPLAGSVVTGGI
ncbi:hypothetical protein HKBW3S47_02470, partial [Candidatus Hakubella thermalkaliphila]